MPLQTPDWLPWVLMGPMIVVVLIGFPCWVIGAIWAAIRDNTWQEGLLHCGIAAAVYMAFLIGGDILGGRRKERADAEQETTIQRQQGQDSQAVRTESQRQPPRVRRAVAEVPSSLPRQAPTVRGVHGQGEDSSSHSDRPHQGCKRAKRSAVLGGDQPSSVVQGVPRGQAWKEEG